MRRCDDDRIDVVILSRLHCRDSTSASVLSAVHIDRHPLDVAGFRHGNNDLFLFDQFLVIDLVFSGRQYFCSPVIAILIRDRLQLFFHLYMKERFIAEDQLEPFDLIR